MVHTNMQSQSIQKRKQREVGRENSKQGACTEYSGICKYHSLLYFSQEEISNLSCYMRVLVLQAIQNQPLILATLTFMQQGENQITPNLIMKKCPFV